MPVVTDNAVETTSTPTAADNGQHTPKAPAKAKTAKPAKKAAPKAKIGKAKANTGDKGLRLGQVRMLKFLCKHKTATRNELVQAACPGRENPTLDASYIGRRDGKPTDKKFGPSLLALGYIKEITVSDSGKIEYTITASGRSAAQKA